MHIVSFITGEDEIIQVIAFPTGSQPCLPQLGSAIELISGGRQVAYGLIGAVETCFKLDKGEVHYESFVYIDPIEVHKLPPAAERDNA